MRHDKYLDGGTRSFSESVFPLAKALLVNISKYITFPLWYPYIIYYGIYAYKEREKEKKNFDKKVCVKHSNFCY